MPTQPKKWSGLHLELLKNRDFKSKGHSSNEAVSEYIAPARQEKSIGFEELVPFHSEADKLIEYKRQIYSLFREIREFDAKGLNQDTQFPMEDYLYKEEPKSADFNQFSSISSDSSDDKRNSPDCVSQAPG
tara:strand:- start:587 stop:979 length:393 start_codon:yes stop_codon:yes gene_type:complete